MKKILFRADGNAEIGLGHFMRLISLVEILKKDFQCSFAIQQPAEYVKDILAKNGTELIELFKTEDYIKEANQLVQHSSEFDLIVFDGYHFRTEYQTILKNGDWSMLYVDDLHEYKIESDAVLNHAVGVLPDHYDINEGASLYLGTEYAMLRKDFLDAAKTERKFDQNIKAFVCLGGADPNNHTKSIVEKLHSLKGIEEINVVVGKAYAFYDDLLRYDNLRLNIFQGLSPEDMVLKMKHSTLGVVSSSNISYEYASIGGMMFVIQTADNQKDIHHFLLSKGLATHVDKLNEVSLSEKLFYNHLEKQRKYFDGNSDTRIIEKIKKLVC